MSLFSCRNKNNPDRAAKRKHIESMPEVGRDGLCAIGFALIHFI